MLSKTSAPHLPELPKPFVACVVELAVVIVTLCTAAVRAAAPRARRACATLTNLVDLIASGVAQRCQVVALVAALIVGGAAEEPILSRRTHPAMRRLERRLHSRQRRRR